MCFQEQQAIPIIETEEITSTSVATVAAVNVPDVVTDTTYRISPEKISPVRVERVQFSPDKLPSPGRFSDKSTPDRMERYALEKVDLLHLSSDRGDTSSPERSVTYSPSMDRTERIERFSPEKIQKSYSVDSATPKSPVRESPVRDRSFHSKSPTWSSSSSRSSTSERNRASLERSLRSPDRSIRSPSSPRSPVFDVVSISNEEFQEMYDLCLKDIVLFDNSVVSKGEFQQEDVAGSLEDAAQVDL